MFTKIQKLTVTSKLAPWQLSICWIWIWSQKPEIPAPRWQNTEEKSKIQFYNPKSSRRYFSLFFFCWGDEGLSEVTLPSLQSGVFGLGDSGGVACGWLQRPGSRYYSVSVGDPGGLGVPGGPRGRLNPPKKDRKCRSIYKSVWTIV